MLLTKVRVFKWSLIKKTVMMMVLFGHHVATAFNVQVENGNQL
jgi:hypothetical protein